VLPSDEAYDSACQVWNAAIDKHAALIARCGGVVDVVRAVESAREHELLVAVVGGAHDVAGHGPCEGRVVIASATGACSRTSACHEHFRSRRSPRSSTARERAQSDRRSSERTRRRLDFLGAP
jgi:hypothetical protein